MYREVIDKEKVLNNFEKFVTLEQGEKWLLFCDNTIMGNGKEGIVLTQLRIIHFKKSTISSFPLTELAGVEPYKFGKGKTLGIVLTDQAGDTTEIKLTVVVSADLDTFINEIRAQLSNDGAEGTASQNPIPDAEAQPSPSTELPAPRKSDETTKKCSHVKKGQGCAKQALPGTEFCWEHLPNDNKAAFHNTLKKQLEQGNDLSGAILVGVDMSPLPLKGANLSRCNLSDAKLTNTNLGNAKLVHADLSGADLRKANLTGADLSEAQISPKTSFRCTTLEGTNLQGVLGLQEVSFNGSYLGDTSGIPADDRSAVKASADRIDLKTPLLTLLMVFGGTFALINIVFAFITVAIPLGMNAIIVYIVVGWSLAGAGGALVGVVIGSVLGIVPLLIYAKATKGKRSPHADGGVS
ncbi:MAG: pentapeptide repeat-containing protein [Candidatus Alcyoniella australis]|nr:pentapeptide repeat-containing protein [Candidatus Alcyoniella australis]